MFKTDLERIKEKLDTVLALPSIAKATKMHWDFTDNSLSHKFEKQLDFLLEFEDVMANLGEENTELDSSLLKEDFEQVDIRELFSKWDM